MSAIQKDQQAIQKNQQVLQMLKVLYPQLANVPEQEIIKAVAVARRLGLDILEEVHFIPFGGRVQIVVSYRAFLKRAIQAGLLEWWKVETGEDNFGVYAEVVIKRRDWQELFRWRVYLNEVKRDTRVWKEMPIMMLRKAAIAQGFKLCFPEVLDFEKEQEEQQAGQDHSLVMNIVETSGKKTLTQSSNT